MTDKRMWLVTGASRGLLGDGLRPFVSHRPW
jgi:hypothetical protein